MNYRNGQEVMLTKWETIPSKRNLNNEVCIQALDTIDLKVGDCILGGTDSGSVSTYEITEFIETRPSTLKGRTFLRAKTKWYAQPLQ